MKKLFIIAVLVMMQCYVKANTSEEAAQGLIRRLLPKHAKHFVVEIISSDQGRDVFEIETKNSHLILRGNNAVSVASALNWYLKNYCNAQVSWIGDQLNIPNPLPAVPTKVRKVNPHKYRVYFNYCTLSYTGVWWDWARWEREIDFMALNGINMPLAATGLDAVWYRTLLRMGFKDEEARAFLVGPAFQAWQWMQNIESYAGPLPKTWIDSHIHLARKIFARERELGMTPIQQGFSGYVPRALKQKFPDVAMVQQPSWVGFPGAMQLDPLDPLFAKFGRTFLEEEIKLFGTSHFYGADPFHESKPPRPGADYLNQVGKAILNVMSGIDPKAVWVMQAWSIRKEIATAVPRDRLLILDLNGVTWRKNEKFWGYEFVVGQLHNFGGRINLHGDLAYLASNPFVTSRKEAPNAVGMGLFMEGTMQNPAFYDLTLDMVWREESVDVHEWLSRYVRRRYGADSDAAREAWELLLKTAYKEGTSGVEYSSIVAARPALDVKKSGPNAPLLIPYQQTELMRAWELLLKDRARLKTSDGYQFDVVDVGRQALSNLGQELQKEAAQAFKEKDARKFDQVAKRFLELLADIDTLVSTRNEYNFGKWIADASRWGTTEEEKRLYEWNASMLLTLWGPEDEPRIFDYAWREWAGLIRTYYLPRWKMFYEHLAAHLARGSDYSEEGLPKVYGREAFRANDFYGELADWEINWVRSQKTFPATPTGDPVKTAVMMLERYRPVAN